MGRLPSHNAAQAPKGRSECVGIPINANHLPLESFFLVASPSVQLSTAGRFGVMRQGSLLWSMAEGVHAKPQ